MAVCVCRISYLFLFRSRWCYEAFMFSTHHKFIHFQNGSTGTSLQWPITDLYVSIKFLIKFRLWVMLFCRLIFLCDDFMAKGLQSIYTFAKYAASENKWNSDLAIWHIVTIVTFSVTFIYVYIYTVYYYLKYLILYYLVIILKQILFITLTAGNCKWTSKKPKGKIKNVKKWWLVTTPKYILSFKHLLYCYTAYLLPALFIISIIILFLFI